MIRLVSGDFAEWTDAPCPCGRTYPRFPYGVIGRIDDMLVIRGENVYPSAIEEAIRAFVGELSGEFEIVVRKRAAIDELIVRLASAKVALPTATRSGPSSPCAPKSACARQLSSAIQIRWRERTSNPGASGMNVKMNVKTNAKRSRSKS